ncbi:MAG: nucleotidyltransferase family protein [Clostridia bacterium]|nr:nucleotidyltransferase family protein [Clostridia bacterium]
MKRTAAIICEFNPLHMGHERILSFARESGADTVVCIMSGNFVQRGEPAITDKYTRARTAIEAGADLVLELPMPYSAASAEYFAFAGVSIADRLGCVDDLVFGSESGDISELSKIAENQLSKEFQNELKNLYSGDMGYAVAAQSAYEKIFGSSPALKTPNNILAIEYIKALRLRSSSIRPLTISREDNFLSEELAEGYPSATALRKAVFDGDFEKIGEKMNTAAYETLLCAKEEGTFPVDMKKYSFCLYSFMRMADPEHLVGCEGMGGGLENRIVLAALESTDENEFLEKLSTKKYTDARIRRTLLAGILGVTHEDMKTEPPYVNLLAANEKGRELLSAIRKDSSIAITTRQADIKKVLEECPFDQRRSAERIYEISKRADALFTMCLPKPRDAGFFEKMNPFVANK